jgi:hypothetical protein
MAAHGNGQVTMLDTTVKQATSAHTVKRGEVIQSLWSGYGEIVRYALQGTQAPSAILKHVIFPSERNHPRGWNNDISHQRKVKSYQVEMACGRNAAMQAVSCHSVMSPHP